MYPSSQSSGFTLVELAIVLMIIGLLIGGVLRGQELMNNARVSAVIQQVKAYDGALATFQDTYSMLPGDMVNPGARLPNCTTPACNTSGNGNGLIAPIGQSPQALGTTTQAYPITGENATFWTHLAAAHLISGVNPAAAVTANDNSWGQQFPASKIGGGFQVVTVAVPANVTSPGASGPYLVLIGDPNRGHFVGVPGQNAITGVQASQIDRKMDDGLPQNGDIIAAGPVSECMVQGPDIALYQETSDSRICNLMFKMQR